METEWEWVESALRRVSQDRVVGGLLAAVLSVPLLVLFGWAEDSPRWLVAWLCLGAVLLGVAISLSGLRRRPVLEKLLADLRRDPRQMVWVYVYEFTLHDPPFVMYRSLELGLADGRRVTLLPARSHLERTLEAVQALAPEACVGFSDERAERFRRDPASLAQSLDPALGDPTARRLLGHLEKGDWGPAHEFLTSCRDADRLYLYVGILADSFAPLPSPQSGGTGRPSWLQEWWEQHPDSAVANLVRGVHSMFWAWEARGYGRGDTLTEADANLFFERLREAEEDLLRAARLAPEDATAWAYLLRCGRGLQHGLAEAERRFAEVKARDPFHRGGHSQMLQTVAAKWGGSSQRMWQLARSVSAPEGHGLHGLRVEAHLEESFAVEGYFGRDEVRDDLLAAYRRSLASPCFSESACTVCDRNLFACALWLAGCRLEARQEFRLLNGRVAAVPWRYFGDPLEVYARAQEECG